MNATSLSSVPPPGHSAPPKQPRSAPPLCSPRREQQRQRGRRGPALPYTTCKAVWCGGGDGEVSSPLSLPEKPQAYSQQTARAVTSSTSRPWAPHSPDPCRHPPRGGPALPDPGGEEEQLPSNAHTPLTPAAGAPPSPGTAGSLPAELPRRARPGRGGRRLPAGRWRWARCWRGSTSSPPRAGEGVSSGARAPSRPGPRRDAAPASRLPPPPPGRCSRRPSPRTWPLPPQRPLYTPGFSSCRPSSRSQA